MSRLINQEQDITTVVFPEDYDPDHQPTDADVKTDAIAAALNDDPSAFINVSRQSDGGRSPMEFVGRFPADKFDFGQLQIHLQDNYGGGDYRCMLYVKGKVKANKLLTIASPKMRNESGDTSLLLNRMMDRMEKMQNQIVTIMQDKTTGGNSRMEFMQELMMMKQIFSNDQKQTGSGLGQIAETVEVLKTLGVSIGGGESESGGFSGLLSLAAPLLQKAMEAPAPQTQPQLTAPPRQQLRPNPIQPIQPQKLPPEIERKREMNLMIRLGINQLVAAAKREGDHHEYAVMVLDNIPEETAIGFFKDPSGMAKLIEIQPEVSNHLIWFETVGEHVKAILGLPCKPEINALYLGDDEENLQDQLDADIVDDNTTLEAPDNGTNKLHDAGNS
jgi:hypothetical protein